MSVSLLAGEREGAPGRCVCGKLLKQDGPSIAAAPPAKAAEFLPTACGVSPVALRAGQDVSLGSRRVSPDLSGGTRPLCFRLFLRALPATLPPSLVRHVVFGPFSPWCLERGGVTVQVQIPSHFQVLKSPSLKWQHLEAANPLGNSPRMDSPCCFHQYDVKIG